MCRIFLFSIFTQTQHSKLLLHKMCEIHNFEFDDINEGYIYLVNLLLNDPDWHEDVEFEGSGKGIYINKKSRSHLENVRVVFRHPETFKGWMVKCNDRSGVMNDYAKKEADLFDKGVIDSTEMGKISRVWKTIANPDGTINANYGFMVYHLKDAGNALFTRKEEFRSQIQVCEDTLKKNIYSLQAVMHFHRPKDQYSGNLDQPCTMYVQFRVRDNKLGLICNMRSNDVIYGMPYNVSYFLLLQKRMVEYLNLCNSNGECDFSKMTSPTKKMEIGVLIHNVTSLHLYDDKIDIAKKIVGY